MTDSLSGSRTHIFASEIQFDGLNYVSIQVSEYRQKDRHTQTDNSNIAVLFADILSAVLYFLRDFCQS